jgi:hypothetical protein
MSQPPPSIQCHGCHAQTLVNASVNASVTVQWQGQAERRTLHCKNKTKVICADLLDFDCDLDLDFEEIFRFCDISVWKHFFLVIFQLW